MGFKTLILGEKMPDKDDPQYRAQYEKDVEAGKKFAKAVKLDKGVAKIQHFATFNRTAFLVIIFTFVALCVGLNIYRMSRAYRIYNYHPDTSVTTHQYQHSNPDTP